MANESLEFEEALNDYLPSSNENGEIIEGIVIRIDTDTVYLDINDKKEGKLKLSELENVPEIDERIEVQVIRNEEDYIILSHKALLRKRKLETIKEGDILKGKITKSQKNGYAFQIGPVSAILPYSMSGIKKGTNAINKEFEVIVVKKSKNLIVSRVDLVNKETNEFFDKYSVGDLIDGKVIKLLDFGAVVSLGAINGFIHISELSWKNVEKISDIIKVSDVRPFRIIEIDRENKNIKLSLKRTEENPWEIMKKKYKVGDEVTGKVKSIFEFGILIGLNDKEEVFMHVSDITCRKVSDINAIYKLGDEVTARIIGFNEEKERVQVSAKVILEEILEKIDEKYSVGDVQKGKVINIQEYGIFVEMEDKVEVFIHKNEFTWHNEKIKYNLGDIVEFKLIKVDKAEKKLSGSIRELTKSPWDEASELYDEGDRLIATISDIIDAGALVPLTENFKALIPKKELSTKFIENTTDVVNIGDEVEVIIIEINPKKKSIILSIRAVEEEEENPTEDSE